MTQQTKVIDNGLLTGFIANLANVSNASVMQLRASLDCTACGYIYRCIYLIFLRV